VTLGLLNSLGFAPSSKNGRFLQKPVKTLTEKTDLFEYLIWDGCSLQWQFSCKAAAMNSDKDRYALMLAEDIAFCSNDLDVGLIAQIYLRHRMDRPQFPLLHADSKVPWSFESEKVSVSDSFKVKLKRALQKWSTLKKFTFVVELQHTGSRPGCTAINIRFAHMGSIWTKAQLLRCHPRSEIFVVEPEAKPDQDDAGIGS
jgi:hypothetical protein